LRFHSTALGPSRKESRSDTKVLNRLPISPDGPHPDYL